jgi:hypothetical protein
MQLLQAATPIQRLNFRSRSNAFYEQVSYPFPTKADGIFPASKTT